MRTPSPPAQIRSILGIAALALAASCSHNVPHDYKFDPAKATGVVAGSISFQSTPGEYVLVAQSVSSKEYVEFSFGCPVFPCLDRPTNDEAYSSREPVKQRAGGYAVEVPEGTYRIVGWRVTRGSERSRSTQPVDLEFVVERGKTSYLGNLHFGRGWKDVTLRDKAERDLPLLRTGYPAVGAAPLAYTIKPGTEIHGIGGAYQRTWDIPVFVPIVVH